MVPQPALAQSLDRASVQDRTAAVFTKCAEPAKGQPVAFAADVPGPPPIFEIAVTTFEAVAPVDFVRVVFANQKHVLRTGLSPPLDS